MCKQSCSRRTSPSRRAGRLRRRRTQCGARAPSGVRRRDVLSTGAGGLLATATEHANAAVLLEDADGDSFTAYEAPFSIRVAATQDAVSTSDVQAFKKDHSKYAGLQLAQKKTLHAVYEEVIAGAAGAGPDNGDDWGGKAGTADLALLGDRWLQPAIRRGALRPFEDADSYRYGEELPAHWRALLSRGAAGEASGKGALWGVPHSWSPTLIAYNHRLFSEAGLKPIHDWLDLLQPRLAAKVAFLDSARDFVGAAAKTLGLSFNASAADMARCGVSEERLLQRCRALRGQVRAFSNSQLFAALSGRDVWAVVGPAAEAMAVAKRYYDVRVVVPVSGTTLAAHVWTQPADLSGRDPSPLVPVWVERGLMPGRDPPLHGLSEGFLPWQLPGWAQRPSQACRPGFWEGERLEGAAERLRADSAVSAEVLARSEFLLPLAEREHEMYRRICEQM